jgi:hypothetical protein
MCDKIKGRWLYQLEEQQSWNSLIWATNTIRIVGETQRMHGQDETKNTAPSSSSVPLLPSNVSCLECCSFLSQEFDFQT